MNTYHPGDDDSDTGAILCGKKWLENDPEQPQAPIISEIPPYPNRISLLNEPAKPKIDEPTNALSNCQHQLAKKDQQIAQLTTEKKALQNDLSNLSEQNATLRQEKHQIQQNLANANQTINQLEQELTNEQTKQIVTENNLTQEKQNNQSLKEINTNLTQKLHADEQNHANLTNAYQIALKAKEQAQKQLNQFAGEIKNFAKMLHQ